MSPIHYPVPHLPYLGKGSMLLDVFDANGLPTGFQHLGNCTSTDQELKDDQAKLYQHINAVPSLMATAVKKRDVMLKLAGTDFSADHMAIALMGSAKTALDTGSTAVSGEVLASATATKKGRYFATLGRNLDPVSISVSQAGALTLGTDYVIADAVQGIIYFPLTSAVNDAVAVNIDYTPLPTTLFQVAGGVVPFVKGSLRFTPDPTDGPKIGVEWWRVNLSPSGKVELIKDDYANWELEVMVLSDELNHPNNPYFQLTYY